MTDTSVLDGHPLVAGPTSETQGSAGPLRPLAGGTLGNLEWRQAVGALLLLAGVVAVFVAWFGISGTLDPGKQMPYLVSGGIGGAALIAIGMTLFLSLEHARDRAALGEVLDRLDALERRLEQLDGTGADAGRAANGRRRTQTSVSRVER